MGFYRGLTMGLYIGESLGGGPLGGGSLGGGPPRGGLLGGDDPGGLLETTTL